MAASGSGNLVRPGMSVTLAPRARAASAMATPIRPGAAVADEPDGVDGLGGATRRDHDVPAIEVRRAARRQRAGGRACGPAARTGRPPTASTTASTMRGSSARRPEPDCPEASGPNSGAHDPVAEVSLRRATLARVAGCVHMSPSIAGATTTGRRSRGRRRSRRRSRCRWPSRPASGRSRRDDDRVGACPRRRCGRSAGRGAAPARRSRPAWRDRASSVSGPTNAVAEGVSSTGTSAPSAVSSAEQLDAPCRRRSTRRPRGRSGGPAASGRARLVPGLRHR